MKINRNNYEAYFIDYLEGNLDERLVDDFIEFLQNNPDLKEELSLFESISIETENISFNKKENLYKEKYDLDNEFNQAAIAALEDDISEKEKAEFDKYILAHPKKQKDIVLFGKTKLQPDESILFNKKNTLYHYSVGRAILLWSGRVAAVLVLALTFYILIDRPAKEITHENQFASVEDKTSKKEVIPESKKIPVKTEKKVPEKTKKGTPKLVIKKTAPEKKPNKSLRENTRGRMEDEDLTMIRVPLDVPAELRRLEASVNIRKPTATLAIMHIAVPENADKYYEEHLFVDVVKEKTGLDKFKFNKISKAGLNLVANISKDKFRYKTNAEGKITGYNYDSRLVAFSIPTKNIGAGK